MKLVLRKFSKFIYQFLKHLCGEVCVEQQKKIFSLNFSITSNKITKYQEQEVKKLNYNGNHQKFFNAFVRIFKELFSEVVTREYCFKFY